MAEWKEVDILYRNNRTSPTRGTLPLSQRESQGSIVLEASLVMPVFIIVIFFFIYMVQAILLTTQMHTAASNMVKVISSHSYPIALALESQDKGTDKGNNNENDKANGDKEQGAKLQIKRISLVEWTEQYVNKLPPPLSDWVRAAVIKGDEPLQQLQNKITESVLDPIVKPWLAPFLENTSLKEERIHISRVTIPDFKTGKNPYFSVEISYELPITIPFTNRPIVLQSRAEERAWIGDTGELDKESGEESGQGQSAVVLSKPEPAYAGHRATISAKIQPNSIAKLTVYYKSGTSQARYLGEAVGDDSGIVSWEWLVGGNTTPGTWTFVIETEDGAITSEVFDVVSPNRK